MRCNGTLLDQWEGKLELTAHVLGEVDVTVLQYIPYKSEYNVSYAMYIMNQISTKLLWIKTGSDLAAEFCKCVDQQSVGAETVVIGFKWYSENSLKPKAWQSHQKEDKNKAKQID